MQVVFFCSNCNKKFSVSDEMAGKRIRCKECRHEMVIPAESELEEVAEPWIVECDQCGRSHKPRDEHEGKRIKCKCGEVIHLVRGAAADLRVQQDLADPYEQGDLAGALPGLSEMDDPWSAGSAYPPHTPQMPAYVPPQAAYPNSPGQSPAAPAGANHAWTPPAAAQVPPPNFSVPQSSGPVAGLSLEQQRRLKKEREDKLLGKFDTDDSHRQASPSGGELGDGWFSSGIAGGLGLIIAGAIWLVIGLNFEILFYFPVFMIIAGLVSMIRSLL